MSCLSLGAFAKVFYTEDIKYNGVSISPQFHSFKYKNQGSPKAVQIVADTWCRTKGFSRAVDWNYADYVLRNWSNNYCLTEEYQDGESVIHWVQKGDTKFAFRHIECQ